MSKSRLNNGEQFMAVVKAKPDKIAMRYGGVLFDLAQKENSLETVFEDLSQLKQSMELEPLEWLRVISPSLPLYTQHRIVESIISSLGLRKLMGRFLLVLCDHRRLIHLNLILEEFMERSKKAEGIIEGVLETSVKFSAKELQTLENTLNSQLGKKVKLNQKTKENLLGGFVLTIGSLMIDASIRTQLNKLRKVMEG